MLAEYAANPAGAWAAKDAAMYVMLALTVQGTTAAEGAVKLNANVNVGDFFARHVLPELQRADVNALPVLKADALKFVSVFRSQLPRDALVSLLPLLVAHLRSTEVCHPSGDWRGRDRAGSLSAGHQLDYSLRRFCRSSRWQAVMRNQSPGKYLRSTVSFFLEIGNQYCSPTYLFAVLIID